MSSLAGLNERYDVVVVGGGVHGAAAVLEASRLGYDALLVERSDFCSSTSSNSLKIIHGGLRYLQSADVRRSRESALEQSRLLDSAPHLVRILPCVMGVERSLSRGRLAVSLGLWLYDNLVCVGLANRRGGRLLSLPEAGRLVDGNVFECCTGAALWHDAQVLDSERLVMTYLKTAERAGARVLNYVSATAAVSGGAVAVELEDAITGASGRIHGDVLIDTASFLDPHRHWNRAVNLVVNRKFPDVGLALKLNGESRDSGRMLFATPLWDKTIIGTWYFPDRPGDPPALQESELDRCLRDTRDLLPWLEVADRDVSCIHVGRLPVKDSADPLSLLERPVVRAVNRDRRMISVTGVKYTTAGPTATRALRAAGLAGKGEARGTEPWYGTGRPGESIEAAVKDHWTARSGEDPDEAVIRRLCRQYGAVAVDIATTAARLPGGFERIPGCDAIRAEIHYCIEAEYCRSLADYILRRSGIGSLGAPPDETLVYCAAAMGRCFGWSNGRIAAEIGNVKAHYRRVEAGP